MLALVAGQGALPGELCRALAAPPLVAALEGFPPEGPVPDIWFRIERLGSLLADLRDRGVTRVCFAGSLSRPPLDPAAVDAATMPLVPRMMAALQAGDDAALRTVLAFFEEAGFALYAAQDIAPALLAGPDLRVGPVPDARQAHDLARAAEVHALMGAADTGQALVVHRGQVIAMEGLFGTDWMLDSLSRRPDAGGGVLWKAPKPAQDRRIDLPAIGPRTVALAAAARLDAIAVASGGVLVLDRAGTLAASEAAGIALWTVP